MAHVLAKLAEVKVEDVKRKLEEDASVMPNRACIWSTSGGMSMILMKFYSFSGFTISATARTVNIVHAEARREDPNAKLP